MSETKDTDRKPLSLARPGKLELKKGSEPAAGQVRQSFPHGRTKTVQVEVRKKRVVVPGEQGRGDFGDGGQRRGAGQSRTLTAEERASRMSALQGAIKDEEARRQAEIDQSRRRAEEEAKRKAEEEVRRKVEEEAKRKAEEDAKRKAEEDAKRKAEDEVKRKAEEEERRKMAERAGNAAAAKAVALTAAGKIAAEPEEDAARPKRPGGAGPLPPKRAVAPPPKRMEPRRRGGKITVTQALNTSEAERVRSMAAQRRAREKERRHQYEQSDTQRVVRDVVVPETITVQELASRMAARSGEVIKSLMKMGVMATINQTIDADTAELVVAEFGHNVKRVSEADVEIGLKGEEDVEENLLPRSPVVTVMGHVDHGKTSLLDAIRATDVAAREAGGITQHIGAYQVTVSNGRKITFIDTPGHEAFTAMRARGATVTDIVVLVVAADDGVMPQTIEAIRHAQAAQVPMIVAINKMDRADANPDRVRTELLQHGVVVENLGGEVLDVEVSAVKRTNIEKLEELILLQADLLDLRSNPNRTAEGVVIEAKLERGRGAVATVLIQRGTLRMGDVFVTGSEWGRARLLLDDRGEKIEAATPGMPVEVLGLNGVPLAGDDFQVVENESRARDVTAFRSRRRRDQTQAAGQRGTVEEMLSQIASGQAKELAIVVKSDVQGSLEAITGSLAKLATDEVAVRVLHAAVGGINESDVTLARASGGFIIGFNVRANPQARDLARRDGVDIRYYSIIYDVVDDVKLALQGMLTPTLRERFLGNAQILEVFNITRVGKVAGCRVTEGTVKRGAKVRLLRDDVVIHEGSLKTLKRFKDEVREVKEGFECGMAFENYNDIQPGDVIECFEMEEVARQLA
ncbi:translation initiation factor IF-2 [Stella sp.]|uniref:translation initiation factor IF-2 n=1 Tax=Stella sp. TaxID=2912054 RepID=UPI0035B08059